MKKFLRNCELYGYWLFFKMAAKKSDMFDVGTLFMMYGSLVVYFNHVTNPLGSIPSFLIGIVAILACLLMASWAHELETAIHRSEYFQDLKEASETTFSEFKSMFDLDQFKK